MNNKNPLPDRPEAQQPTPEGVNENDWFDDILKKPVTGKEIGEDEHAESLGLTPFSEQELEKIIQETLSEDWISLEDEAELPLTQEDFRDDEFRNTFGTNDILNPAYYTDNGELPEEENLPPEPVEEPEESVYEEPDEPDPEESGKLPRKVRPKRKNGYGLFGIPHLISVVIWVMITVTIGISLGNLVWVCASEILAFGRDSQKVTVTITNSDTIETITNKLYNAGLIKYPSLFKFYADLSKAESKISVGTFDLNTQYDYHALVGGMSATSSYRQSVKVLIPEGYTCAQIFALLEEKGVCAAKDLEEFAANGEIRERWFLEDVARGDKYCLEGFLSPDTYQFYTNDTPSRVIGKFLDAFSSKLNSLNFDAQTQLAELNTRLSAMMAANGYDQAYIDAHQITIRDLVTVASMIEKESANSAESYTVSAVIYNRLTSPDFPNLQIDATVVYALGGKNDLTTEDLQIEHPYNTYKAEGLPPGPISNPGLSSLYAAFDPDEDPYYYYALDPSTGSHHFSKTYKEHQQFLESIR